uniref:Glycosyltransferase n=1 Tax=Rheum palmatum TaxID=137221 RepID=A0A9F2IBY9_RHEPA|nr:UDP-glucose glucosyltransferase [Rheum palmatum]
MASHNHLHMVFVPLMAHGHMIPLFDIARLFAARGVKATLVTTPANAAAFPKPDAVEIVILRFPSAEVGIPEGVENITQLTEIDHTDKFVEALKLIAEGPLAELLEERRPSCLVSDMFLPWSADVAARVDIPWVAFHGGGYYAQAVSEVVRRDRPQWGVESEDDEFDVPGLPGGVRFTRRKLPSAWTEKEGEKSAHTRMVEAAFETAAERSFGVMMNSFYELESDYADHYPKFIRGRCWSLGPASLCFRNMEDKANRGKQANIDVHECLNWLDSKPPNSVIYVCFGSITHVSSAQLIEIATALEASNQHFIWVVRRPNHDDEEWLPSGFEARNKGKGLIIRGWAPQVMILDHVATGGFVTHCGWNSTLEGVSAGVPMVTWPMFAEQFLNEKLATEVLRVGVSVGADQNCDWLVEEARVRRAEIEAAVRRVMVGEEAEEMRRRAAALKELAWKAVQEGGSSYNGLTQMLDALTSIKC